MCVHCARCCAPRAAGTRASVRNVVPLLVTVTSAHAAQYHRCIILCACRARRCIYRRTAANARASSEYTLRDVPYLFVLHTPPRGACFLRESLRYRHRDEDDGSLGVRDFRSTCAKTLPERKRATPRFRNPSRAGSTWSTKSVAVARECV